jgi:hypothetical protein
MDNTEPQNLVMFVMRLPKPFKGAKAMDICRVAQRILDETGHVCAHDVYEACRTRIPGAFNRYAATIKWLAVSDFLKPRRKKL